MNNAILDNVGERIRSSLSQAPWFKHRAASIVVGHRGSVYDSDSGRITYTAIIRVELDVFPKEGGEGP
jgi:hypothetical protein